MGNNSVNVVVVFIQLYVVFLQLYVITGVIVLHTTMYLKIHMHLLFYLSYLFLYLLLFPFVRVSLENLNNILIILFCCIYKINYNQYLLCLLCYVNYLTYVADCYVWLCVSTCIQLFKLECWKWGFWKRNIYIKHIFRVGANLWYTVFDIMK